MPDLNINVNDQQNVINTSAGIYPSLLVTVDHEANTVSVVIEKQAPVVDVQVIATGPVGPGVAAGGTTGQVLKKASGSNYDTVWADESVASVNGQTGAVSLFIPSNVSDITNDSGFVDSAGAAAAAPVQSVNSYTGAVSLTYSDVNALPNDISIAKGTDANGRAVDIGYLGSSTVSGDSSVSIGRQNTVSGTYSLAAGYNNTVSGNASVAEGRQNTASGNMAHAEGYNNKATNQSAHVEGQGNESNAIAAHAEGYQTKANAQRSHAEGYATKTNARNAHAEGGGTIANGRSQHVFGEYNLADTYVSDDNSSLGTYAEIVGNGTADNARSNARTLDWSGNEVLAGTLTLGAGPTNNMEAATKKYVDDAISGVSSTVTSVNGQTGAVVLDADDVGALPDTTTIPTAVSQLNNDSGFITSESDPVFSASAAAGITSTDISAWNGKSDFSGSYNDLTDKPTIPGDTKVEQSSQTPSSYTYWRPLLVGASSNATEGFTPTTVTDKAYTFKTIEVQPSSGTIKANLKGDVTGTASGNYSASNPPPYPVTSVNGNTGAVTVSVPSASSSTPADLGTASAGSSNDYARADHVHNKPSYTKSDVGLGNVDNVQQYSATNPPPYPVTSVNTQTGDVTLSIPSTAADVGALPDDTKYAASPAVGGVATKAASIPFGKLDGTSTSTVMTASVPGITELKSGVCMWLMNGVVTGGSNFTLNINNLGAKGVYASNAASGRVTSTWNTNYTCLFVYNEDRVTGGCWDYVYGYDSNTNTIGYQIRTNSYNRKTTDKFRYYKILFSSPDGTHWIPAASATDNSATSAKTVNQRPINPFGEIVICSNTTNYAAEADIAATNCWQEYTLTLGYSFNRTGAALTLTTQTPVYVKCAPQTNGSAIIDSTTPIVQALPNSADGKIYIFLGVAYSATNIELTMRHPVYFHDGTGIREWTGKVPFSGDYTDLSNKPTIPSSAADVGAIALPASPTSGDFLVYNGSSWVAMSMAVWQGGSY